MSRSDLLQPPEVHVVRPTPSPTPSPRASPVPGYYQSSNGGTIRSAASSRRSTVSSQVPLLADDCLKPPANSPYHTSSGSPVSPSWTYSASAGASPVSFHQLTPDPTPNVCLPSFSIVDDSASFTSTDFAPTNSFLPLTDCQPEKCDSLILPPAGYCDLSSGNAIWSQGPWYPEAAFPSWPDIAHPKRVDRTARQRVRALSRASFDTPSSSGSTMSSVETDTSGTVTITSFREVSRCASPLSIDDKKVAAPPGNALVCLGPQCLLSFATQQDLTEHVKENHAHCCYWQGCPNPSQVSRDALTWHVKEQHLLICPIPGCPEVSFEDVRMVRSHVAVAHPQASEDDIKNWQLQKASPPEVMVRTASTQSTKAKAPRPDPKQIAVEREMLAVTLVKRKCHDQLRNVVEKKVKRSNAGTPRNADSPTDMVRARASRIIDNASFPLVFEHSVLPFLAEFLPKWTNPRHVVSVARGRTAQTRRLCIMTPTKISRARKIIIAGHVVDLLPEKFKSSVSFVFTVGEIARSGRWPRGIGPHKDDVCAPRNPFHFRHPCMGDSIGIIGSGGVLDSTATLGPCLHFGDANLWLANFHPFEEAYRSFPDVVVQHPSYEDRALCTGQSHDALDEVGDFSIGRIRATSGIDLKTTRISHDPYWDENLQDNPLVMTDWALISATQPSKGANILRRFPSDTQPPIQEPLVTSVSTDGSACGIIPGSMVVSSGRTSGYQRGQICEIPAYVSPEVYGTGKATREWFVEEPPGDNEDEWISSGIGVEGDSGGVIVDAETNCLIGQLWGRNQYSGPGIRQTYFTPIADIFDDIQEKCGLSRRPKLPQHREEVDRYAVYPSCRQCYDLRAYLDTRRSSRASFQSMVMCAADGDAELTSVEAEELATPKEFRGTGVEEIGASFRNIASVMSPTEARLGPSTPIIANDIRSPYPLSLDLEDGLDLGSRPGFGDTPAPKKRSAPLSDPVPSALAAGPSKRRRAG
ncbi:putative DNA polymerase epsilon, calytic chain POL2 [Purpureocillium lavendulum]|uniref:DNA polymerase epsilon, calytic chain POL2 n=1 Tax=Purpureocillium lavendulum TaxID=1247861 RepID=A0AB34FNF1_9HYPO|nr:putative DNA polymerase epsilon, calytic chain POL2 [Purpureocillium lavendulum]